jgi:hypothetical protein
MTDAMDGPPAGLAENGGLSSVLGSAKAGDSLSVLMRFRILRAKLFQ